jgi:hypothetical protein
MKKQDVFIYTCFMVLVSLITANVVFSALTGASFLKSPIKASKQITQKINTAKCSDQPKVAGLSGAHDPQLRKLAQYQEACNSLVAPSVMLFTNMPKDAVVAKQDADKMAETLKEFSRYGITPIVVVEPVSDWGLVDFKEFGDGLYDPWVTVYFQELHKQGITDDQMGTWVPFPEANLPYWNHQNTQPQDFARNVNRYVGIMKQNFPHAKASILLNSATYPTDDFDWRNGEYLSLEPYVKDIQKGLIDSFGLQGFPWSPPATNPGPGVFDASEYLSSRLAIETADTLGTKSIWFNTGSFSRKYTIDVEKTVTIAPDKRKDILNGILAEAAKVRDKGYTIAINVFAEDKSYSEEATDWSYGITDSQTNSPDAAVFANFVSQLNRENIAFSLFDKTH